MSGQRVFVKKKSVKETWYKKKSLNLLKPPDLINISGSGVLNDFKNFWNVILLVILFLFNYFAANIISSIPL